MSPAAHRPWVVKLGGSLATSPVLEAWLRLLAAPRDRPIVVVPGGGPFADAVRRAQPLLGFGDGAAHRMALLAMEQYALALADREPRLKPAATPAALAVGNALWLPSAMTADRPDIPESWDVTSDSLAAWLATQLAAPVLLLVKSAPVPGGEAPVGRLVEQGIVDVALPGFLARYAGETWILDAARPETAERMLAGGRPEGVRVVAA